MATATPNVSPADAVPAVARRLPPNELRSIAETNFIFAADLMTYNWIEGNPRSDWDGKPFDWHPTPGHYRHWWQNIQAHPANMFLAARKHTKTTFADCLMIWRCEYNPGHVGLYWSNTQQQVKDRMNEFDQIVEANPWLENVHPNTAAFTKSFGNGSLVDTAWVTKGHEGSHADTVIGDDPMKELGDISDSEVEHWYSSVIVPMINPGEALSAIIGTRKRPNDLYEILRRRHEEQGFDDHVPGYNLIEYPAIRELWQAEYDRPGDLAPMEYGVGGDTVEIYKETHAPALANAFGLDTDTLHFLWPQARDEDFLLRNLGMEGRSWFLREFNMVYRQVEDAFIQREWIDDVTASGPPPTRLDDSWTPAAYPGTVTRSDFEQVIVGHDPAGKGRDRFGFVTVGTLTHPHNALPETMQRVAVNDEGDPLDMQIKHILDVWQAQDVPPARWRDKLTALHDRYAPDSIAIESNLNQTWTTDDEAIPTRVRDVIEPVATTARKHSWEEGVPTIRSDIERGGYRFYGGGEDNQTDELVIALTSLRYDDGRLVGHTPDLVMALYMAHKVLADPSGHLTVSRTNLRHGGASEEAREQEDGARGRLKDAGEVGEAILETAKRRQGGYYD